MAAIMQTNREPHLNGLLALFIMMFGIGSTNAFSQDAKGSMEGEYFMQGVMDMASVLWLKSDSSFEYFFSYGALDRGGKGKWQVIGNKLILNSATRPEKDFALVSQSSKSLPGTMIRIAHENKILLPYVFVRAYTDKGVVEGKANQEGVFQVKSKKVDSIALMLEICPDRFSVFKVGKSDYYEFRIEPWIAEIFFSNFTLEIQSNILTGPHPLIDGSTYRYVKASN